MAAHLEQTGDGVQREMPAERATGPRGSGRTKGAASAAVRERTPPVRTRVVYTLAFLANAVVLAALLWALVTREQPPDKEEYTEKALDVSSRSGRTHGGRTRRASYPPTDHFVSDEPSLSPGEDFKVSEHPIHGARTVPAVRNMSSSDEEKDDNRTTTSFVTSTVQITDNTNSNSTFPGTNKATEYASVISENTRSTSSAVPSLSTDYVMTNLSTEPTDQTWSHVGSTAEETFSFDVDTTPSYNVVCYFNHTSYRRDEPMSFRTGHIPVPYCSHIIYASVGVGEDFALMAKDPVFDIERQGFAKFAKLKARYRHVTVMAAIGEDADDSNAFRRMSKSRPDVAAFARNVASWLREYEYDGVVIQWKMSAQRPGDASSRASWFRKKLLVVATALRDSLGARAELFVAVPNNEEIRQAYFNIAELSRYVDRFLAIGSWVLRDRVASKVTSFPDPLSDVLQTRHSLVGAGNVPLFRKFCFVLSVSARSYTLLSSGHHEIHAATSGPGRPGRYTRQPGVLAYYEFCNETWPTAEKGTFASYVARDDQWVGYMDVSNLQRLLRMALYKHRAACLGIWDVSLDDFRGLCGDAFPFVKAISGWHDREWKRHRREFGHSK
ncbi:hypothetical protein HPB50_027051 [Hyalomma asiaticum]|uniref:Uncharacterized protein n=1 Tax=Hyalomma asiaticum TaxID=266040 RepID=A0ACB7RS12_HYAAI|nr:hypothetical protein HPB50_027051 [Hyalomma asiaticum]